METLYEAVYRHHKAVEDMGALNGMTPVFTVLIGSQNYGLDTPTSDVDTFTFVFPNLETFLKGESVKTTEFQIDENGGKCVVKDIRDGFNCLRKSSPNSIECFLGEYRSINPIYEDIFYKYSDASYKFSITHCNYFHMVSSCLGMAKQVKNRNMPLGKKVAHAIRMEDLCDKYLQSSYPMDEYLLVSPPFSSLAMRAKNGEFSAEKLAEIYDNCIKAIESKREYFMHMYDDPKSAHQIEVRENLYNSIVNDFQLDITKKYLEKNGFTYVETN